MEELGDMALCVGGRQLGVGRGKSEELLCIGSEVTVMMGVTGPGFPVPSPGLIKPSRMGLHRRHCGMPHQGTHKNSQCRARRPTIAPMGK